MSIFTEGVMYFATSYRKDEIDAIRRAKPDAILTSFSMWRTQTEDKSLQTELEEKIGYRPKHRLVDCGSYTFRQEDYGLHEMLDTYEEIMTEDGQSFDREKEEDIRRFAWWWFAEFQEDAYIQDKNDFTLFEQYLNFLWVNRHQYDYCFAFDRIGDNVDSKIAFQIMKALGFPVVPVYQATHIRTSPDGTITEVHSNEEDFDVLDYYAQESDYIAIGGTAITKVKGYTKNKRIQIVHNIVIRHPNRKFHLLGTLDPYIIRHCQQLYSVDGQAWLVKGGKDTKVHRSIDYLNRKSGWFLSAQQLMFTI